MAKLSNFRIDSKAVQTGQWVSPGPEFGDLEVLVRGFTDQYSNAHNAKLRRAARSHGGDPTKLPSEVTRRLLIDSLADHVLLDVRNLEDDDGKLVSVDEFKRRMADPDYPELGAAVLRAASQVGLAGLEATQDAAGNLPAPSATD